MMGEDWKSERKRRRKSKYFPSLYWLLEKLVAARLELEGDEMAEECFPGPRRVSSSCRQRKNTAAAREMAAAAREKREVGGRQEVMREEVRKGNPPCEIP